VSRLLLARTVALGLLAGPLVLPGGAASALDITERCDAYIINPDGSIALEPAATNIFGVSPNVTAEGPAEVASGARVTITLPGPSYVLATSAGGFPVVSFGDVVFRFRVTNATVVPGSAVVSGGLDGSADGSGDLLTLNIPATVPSGTIYDTPDVSFDVVAGRADEPLTVSLVGNDTTARVIAGGAEVPVRALCTPAANILLSTVVVGPAQPEVTEDCRRGGWQRFVDETGQPFRNQGQCVASVRRSDR
jgi:hypothetical protein